VFGNLATALTSAGELDEAVAIAREGLAALRLDESLHLILEPIGWLALKRGRLAQAARAIGHSRAVVARTGDKRQVNEQRAYEATLAALHETMAADEVERLLTEGAELAIEDVVQQALEADTPRG
jgi:hypothetical protein